jgi:hypothetical protein
MDWRGNTAGFDPGRFSNLFDIINTATIMKTGLLGFVAENRNFPTKFYHDLFYVVVR